MAFSNSLTARGAACAAPGPPVAAGEQEIMPMSLEGEAETAVKYVPGLTRVAPASFRGTDCAVLAERYAAYRRNNGLDEVQDDPDRIIPAASSPETA
jgi:hypothetical protein